MTEVGTETQNRKEKGMRNSMDKMSTWKDDKLHQQCKKSSKEILKRRTTEIKSANKICKRWRIQGKWLNRTTKKYKLKLEYNTNVKIKARNSKRKQKQNDGGRNNTPQFK